MNVLPEDCIEIQPVLKTIQIQFLQVQVEQVVLNKGAHCLIVLYDDMNQVCDRQRIFITGADYDRWIADNDIIDVILEKLNLKRKSDNMEDEKKSDETQVQDPEPENAPEEQQIENDFISEPINPPEEDIFMDEEEDVEEEELRN